MSQSTRIHRASKSPLLAAALVAAVQMASAQTMPAVPASSPMPVTNYEYDANGNLTKTIQAPGVTNFNFNTTNTYDSLNRLKDSTNAKSGKTQFGYDGLDRNTKVTDPRNLVTQTPRNGLGDVTSVISPDTGTVTQTFDAMGHLKTRTDSRGVLETYSYDVLNRLSSIVYSKTGQTSLTESWTYDQTGTGFAYGTGRLTSTTHPNGSTQYTYTLHGEVVTDTHRVNAATGANTTQIAKTVTYGYNAAGQLTSIIYPSGRKLTITYSTSQITGISLAKDASSTATALISGIKYFPFGPPTSWLWQMASGTQAHDRVYDLAGRPTRYRLGAYIRDVKYDAADRIASYTHWDAATKTATAAANALNQTMGYDELGRLTSLTGLGGTRSFSYDPNGNRTSLIVNGSTTTTTIQSASNRIASMTNPARTVTYDSAGNTTADGQFTATYDLTGRMVTLTKAGVVTSYTYDGLGRRVRKANSSGTTIFIYSKDGQLLGEYSINGTPLREFVWLGTTPIAMFTPDPANAANPPIVFYLHTDHIDTPRIAVDKNNAVRWRWMAEPFGTTAAETNPSNLGAVTMNLRFPGQYFDQESGLHFNWHRYYDGVRYTQPDPLGLDGGDVGIYSYAGNRPTSFVDPTGLQAVQLLRYGIGAAAAGIALQASRPKDMTRLEERQFDRYCAETGDPCQELKKEARKAITAANPKMLAMLNDTTMFGTPGWATHKADLIGRIDQINSIISLGQKMGCDMSSEIALAAAIYVPNMPLRMMKP